MGCNILVAVDESKSSLKAIRYVAETMQCGSKITLLSVVPDPTAACGLDSPSLTPIFQANKEAFCAIEDTKKERVQEFLSSAKERLIQAGFSPENVRIKIKKKKKGIARDILKEANEGNYDTVVVGRRGLSAVKDFFMGSISNKVVQLASKIAVIVVD